MQMKRRRYRKRRINLKNISIDKKSLYIYGGILFLVILTIILGIYSCVAGGRKNRANTGLAVDASEPKIDVQLLDERVFQAGD